MTTFIPRDSYSQQELSALYPRDLRLEQVQILLRHGERSPVKARFQNAGLPVYWPYCNAARQMRSVIMSGNDSWDDLTFRRTLETFGKDDSAAFAPGPEGETHGICLPGELTDPGRATTLALGQRLRQLYISQLGFMPSTIQNTDNMYLRATPIPRALESVQQAFYGMYPPTSRAPGFTSPTITTRSASDETLFPNEGACRRFAQLSAAFAERTAQRWNDGDDMAYLTKLIGKWMPEDSPRVAVDSHPRLSGIMDTVNSTLAHGPATRLPKEFYDPRGREIIDKIGVEEWFSGYRESVEYRSLGIGGLVGDVVARMVEHTRSTGGASHGNTVGNGKSVRFAMSGCHDTTLAAVLTSMGAFDGEKWPPYTSHIAVELFRKTVDGAAPDAVSGAAAGPSWWSSIFGPAKNILTPASSSRTPLAELSTSDKQSLEGYYVRMRYNDRVMTVPGCKAVGKHYGDDESMCTLEAFKAVADKFTPKSWKQACRARLDEPGLPEKTEPAGF